VTKNVLFIDPVVFGLECHAFRGGVQFSESVKVSLNLEKNCRCEFCNLSFPLLLRKFAGLNF
jgi:hypothetical protein